MGKYIAPIGGAAGDPYIDANPAAGIEGSAVPAAALEWPQRELDHLVTFAGLTADAGDLTQVRQAVQVVAAAAVPSGDWAPIDSAALTGTPTAPTPSLSDDGNRLATTAFVQDLAGRGVLMSIVHYSASGTWSKPPGCSYVVVECHGAGGGGAGGYATNCIGGSGGGGGYVLRRIDASALVATETVTVGTGGAAGAVGGGGGSGGTSSFGAHCSATGGAGGLHYTASTLNGGAGGIGSGGDLMITGGGGTHGSGTANLDTGQGGSSPRGGAGGIIQTVGAATGVTGVAPGGGGSSGRGSGSGGGSGARGGVTVYCFGG